MLQRIICDKFPKQPNPFQKGLNVVLGDDNATNSIGKSTFLMLIDFALGGDDYIELDKDTISKVGDHAVKFILSFDEEKFYFYRNTNDAEYVHYCNDKFESINKRKLSEFKDFLKEKYNLSEDVSFRNSAGRYSRIYPKQNTDQKDPLVTAKGEPKAQAILALLKLFNSYKIISDLLREYNQLNEQKKTISASQKLNLVPSIGKKDYEKNIKQIDALRNQISLVRESILTQTVDIEAIMGDEVRFLKSRRTKITASINSINATLERIIKDATGDKKSDYVSYDELLKFFPNVDIERVKKVDNFHVEISKIISKETKEYKHQLEERLKAFKEEVSAINDRIASITNADNSTQIALENFSKLESVLKKLNEENAFFEKVKDINQKVDAKHTEYIEQQQTVILSIQNDINKDLDTLNKYIYNAQAISPTLLLKEKSYEYKTENDNGTGTEFKNLVILDLAILNLTTLPIVIHDSILLKNIQNDAMDKIAQLYASSKKQIFIAFDKLSSYPETTQKIMNDHCVLKLSRNSELFGYSWSRTAANDSEK
ncbi:MAG: DUF2326 domain-containing protein [Bacilli bacterium]|jgi:hypothetical protein